MKILIVEDNIYKRNKIVSFLKSIAKDIGIIDEASSYSSSIELINNNCYDLLILDMSIPSYDIKDKESGGRFRAFGGKDILKHLKRKKMLLPFIIITQYTTFSEHDDNITLDEIKKEIHCKFNDYYLNTIFYDTTSLLWKEELEYEVNKL